MKRYLHTLTAAVGEDRGFWAFALQIWTVFGLAVSNLFLGLSLLATFGENGRRRLASGGRSLLPVLLYVTVLVCSIVFSDAPRASLAGLRELFALAPFVTAVALLRGEKKTRLVCDGLIAVAAVVALHGLGQTFVGLGEIQHRIRGPFSHYMTFAGILLLADLLLAAQMLVEKANRNVWRWAALGAINLALLVSLTRSAWVAFIISVTALLLIRAPRLVAAYVPAVMLFLALASVPMVHRAISILDLQDTSNYDRLCMAEAGLKMIAERPLLGLGPGQVKERYPLYRNPTAPRQRVAHLHNMFLQLGAEKGLLALGAYLWLVGGAMLSSLLRYRHGNGEARDLYLGVFAALLAFNLAGLFEDYWSDTEVQRVALFVAAIPTCLGRQHKVDH